MQKMNARNRKIIFISIFAALTAIGAYLKIPLPNIPITLQTFFVIMSGNILGFKYAAISQILYLTVGLLGIPVFAYGGGPGYVFQPTFGYLLGYPLGAFTIGILVKILFSNFKSLHLSKIKTFFVYFISDIIGVLIIFIVGLTYLFVNVKFELYMRLDQLASSGINWQHTIQSVFLIFIPIDIIKACLASWFMIHLKKLSFVFILS